MAISACAERKNAHVAEAMTWAFSEFRGRSSRIRTYDLCLPKAALYQAELYSVRVGGADSTGLHYTHPRRARNPFASVLRQVWRSTARCASAAMLSR